MTPSRRLVTAAVIAIAVPAGAGTGAASGPAPGIAAPGTVQIALMHAQGAQIYECKAGETGQLAWQFREPVAALIEGGRTIGRHYGGPSWQLDDASLVTAKVTGRVPGATAGDIPLLRLEVVSSSGRGRLKDAAIVLRLNTRGGVASGGCPRAGDLLSVPYAADYAVLKRVD